MAIKAYLYSLRKNQLTLYEGKIQPDPHTGFARFHTKKKRIICAEEPEVVYNAAVWLFERNDETAKFLLVKYEKLVITKLHNRIDTHLHRIDIIKTSQKLQFL